MPFEKKDIVPINYTSRDYESIRNDLITHVRRYYPTVYQDFNEASFGSIMLDSVAYVGDVLSFYTDTQIQETFLMLAQDRDNLFNLAYAMGYKPKVTSAAAVDLDISQLVPSKQNNNDAYVPDYDYALTINENSTFSSTDGLDFYTENQVNFGFSSSFDPTTISVYQYDSSNNPEYFLLKK